VGTIDRHELLNVLQADEMDERFINTYVFDVRQPEEIVETGALGPDVVNIPLGEVTSGAFILDDDDFMDKYGILKPDQSAELIFSCRAGVRSDTAARIVEQAGYSRYFCAFTWLSRSIVLVDAQLYSLTGRLTTLAVLLISLEHKSDVFRG
jgi:rhodanese-related sulfurtransferase